MQLQSFQQAIFILNLILYFLNNLCCGERLCATGTKSLKKCVAHDVVLILSRECLSYN